MALLWREKNLRSVPGVFDSAGAEEDLLLAPVARGRTSSIFPREQFLGEAAGGSGEGRSRAVEVIADEEQRRRPGIGRRPDERTTRSRPQRDHGPSEMSPPKPAHRNAPSAPARTSKDQQTPPYNTTVLLPTQTDPFLSDSPSSGPPAVPDMISAIEDSNESIRVERDPTACLWRSAVDRKLRGNHARRPRTSVDMASKRASSSFSRVSTCGTP